MPDQPGELSRRLDALDALQKESKGVRADPSALRLYIRDNYTSLVAARGRGVSWQQIADVMVAAGVRAPDGSPLTWRKVAVLFHTERYGKGRKGKRKAARAKERPPALVSRRAEAAAPPPPPSGASSPPRVGPEAPPAPAPAPPPASAINPANPYAEVERRTAEAKARRERIEAAKEWNPYAAPQGKDAPDE